MLHWKHMKGFHADNQGNNTLYTFIELQNKTASGEDRLPLIYTSESNSLSGATLYGHIVTNQVDTTFYNYLDFQGSTYFENTITIKTGTWLRFIDGNTYMSANADNFYIHSTRPTIFESGRVLLNYASGTSSEASAADFKVSGFSYFGKSIKCASSITCLAEVNATYFNATSDIRAKENLMEISTSMLDVVRNTQVYTFNYKNDPSARSIGIMAQDLQDLNLDGASLIDNQGATGVNGDYMRVHETKLVYVLWKAVQELSAEVGRLKKKLGE